MWTGLYIVSLGLILLGLRIEIDKTKDKFSINIDGNIIGRCGFYLIGIITIFYETNLIINN